MPRSRGRTTISIMGSTVFPARTVSPTACSTTNFGVEGTPRRIPRIRHLATSFPKWMDDESDFMTKVFGFREVSTTVERRKANRSTRFTGDGHINLALLSSGLGKEGGRGGGDEAGEV